MDQKTSIGIVGVGMVGSAVAKYYDAKPDIEVRLYDKNKKLGSLEHALQADFVFLCLPSPAGKNGEQDVSSYEETVPKLVSGSKVIIKSTVIPGTTERFQALRPDVFLLHNPEFLDARTAVLDFAKPTMQVVGFTQTSKQYAETIMGLLPPAPQTFYCSSAESEMVKYFLNTFMATKNTFANQMYDYCVAKGINYDKVKDIVKNSSRIGGEVHLRVFQDGYRGFQGACLPKDIAALINDAQAIKPLKLLELVHALNLVYVEEGSNKPGELA
ncbi:MAG: hypothetical protein Q7S28_00775 [bacterium]|nr:hypothetical protein [bacterium]